MARPKKDTNTPELQAVREAQAEWRLEQAKANEARERYEERIVVALEKNGLPTLAAVTEMSIGAMRNIAEKRGAENPRARG